LSTETPAEPQSLSQALDAPVRVFATRQPDGSPAVKVVGDLDMRAAGCFAAGLAAVPDDRSPLVVDMAEVGFIDSTGLNVLLSTRNARTGPEPRVQIINGSPPVLKLLELTGLSDLFGI
jgi:anti-anti-sigma factor